MPSNFKVTSRRRVVARAVDNQVFVLYCNYTGKAYDGGSLVADPGGEVVLDAGTKPGVYIHTIDLGEIAYWRNYEQIFNHRRPKIYTT
ncbi:MAG: carbon-nitrogen hydrolase family protein [Nitrospinota bacterium]